MPSTQGKFVWYELITKDTEAAGAFYQKVMGWTARDAGMAGTAYTIFSMGDAGVGGMLTLPPEAGGADTPPFWMGYVLVDDVDRSVKQAVELGGSIHRPAADIPGVGRFAIIADPQGGVVTLFKESAGGGAAPTPPGAPGHGGWHELYALDREAAFAFYSKLYGWTTGEAMDMGPMGVYQIFNHNGEMLGGMMDKPPTVPMPGWLYYFNVAAIRAAEAKVKASGGQIINGPHEVPGGHWIVQCRDPQGAVFALVAPGS